MKRLLTLAAALLLAAPLWASGADRSTISITTDASGDATAYSSTLKDRARIVYIWYKDGFDDTADFTITCESTGEGLWTESNVTAAKVVAPTKAVQDQVGVDRSQYDYVWCIRSRVKIVIAQGGNAATAVFEVAWF